MMRGGCGGSWGVDELRLHCEEASFSALEVVASLCDPCNEEQLSLFCGYDKQQGQSTASLQSRVGLA